MAPLPDLPEEIIESILILLPVKSLLRFSSVSKSWLSLIQSSRFVRSHLQFSALHKVFSLSKRKQTVSHTPVPPAAIHGEKAMEILRSGPDGYGIHWDHPVDIVGSCNGLVCAVGKGELRHDVIVLWNPVTRQFKELPSSGNEDMILIQIGFGYDAYNDDYKVVELSRCRKIPGERRLKIYSLRSNSWRLIDPNAPLTVGLSGTSGIFVNGAIHWQAFMNGDNSILAINMTTEARVFIEVPDDYHYYELGASEDHLYLSCPIGSYTHVWMMKEYGIKESWTKIMRIKHREISREVVVFPLMIPEYDENSGKSPNEWIIENVCEFEEIPLAMDYINFECATYRPSLVSVSTAKRSSQIWSRKINIFGFISIITVFFLLVPITIQVRSG